MDFIYQLTIHSDVLLDQLLANSWIRIYDMEVEENKHA